METFNFGHRDLPKCALVTIVRRTQHGLVHISVGHISEAKSVATWACVGVACNLD